MTMLDSVLTSNADRGSVSSVAIVTRTLRRLSDAVSLLLEWLERARQRRQLLAMSDSALKDFGACRADAEAEGSKAFWR